MNLKSTLGAALSILLLAGCHSVRHEPWQDAQVAEPLTIPDGLDRPGTSGEMYVPAGDDTVEGAVNVGDALPPTSINMEVTTGVDAAWQQVGTVLDSAGVGTVISRDAGQHHYGVEVRGGELNLPKRGFFYRLMHRSPDLNRSYYAGIDVIEENGQVRVQIDGDGPAVGRVHELLDGKLN